MFTCQKRMAVIEIGFAENRLAVLFKKLIGFILKEFFQFKSEEIGPRISG